MSKHPKPGSGNPHPKPNKEGGSNHKTSVSGDVHVRGEVFIEPTPKETLARTAENDYQKAQDRKRYFGRELVSSFSRSMPDSPLCKRGKLMRQ